jgi:hypothetical protein
MRLHDWFGLASGPGPDTQLQDPPGVGQQVLDEIKETGRSSPGATSWSRWTTGVVITTACRSS